jgi:hypothetical protein
MTYDMDVKRLTLALLVFCGCLVGQAVDRKVAVNTLATSLRELQGNNATLDSHRDRINKDILSLSEESHRPSMYLVTVFTSRLTDALIGRPLPASHAAAMATAIDTVLHSAGLGTWKFKEAISSLEAALQSTGASPVAVKKAATALERIGKEIRGPEGMPIRPLR